MNLGSFLDSLRGREKRVCSYCGEYLRAEVKYSKVEVPSGARDMGITRKLIRGRCPGCGNTDKGWGDYRGVSEGDYMFVNI